VELLGFGGELLWRGDNLRGGTVTLAADGRAQRGYLVARAFGDAVPEKGGDTRTIKHFAVTNPVYLHPEGAGFAAPVRTELEIEVPGGAALTGGRVRLEDAAGAVQDEFEARGTWRGSVGAGGRVTTVTPEGVARTAYLINLNPRLQELQRYLHRGRFVKDYPSVAGGEVPVAAWRFGEHRAALEHLKLVCDGTSIRAAADAG
jgi:hypothetical protein